MKVAWCRKWTTSILVFSVRENLLTYGRYFGMAKSAIVARVPEHARFAGPQQGRRADRAAVGRHEAAAHAGRSLVHDPDICSSTEATTGLDPQARHLIWLGTAAPANEARPSFSPRIS